MSALFSPAHGLVVVSARIWGPGGERMVRLALDTGATLTTIDTTVLVPLGYDPAAVAGRLLVTTGSGIEFLAQIPIDGIEALGQQRAGLRILSHTLPPTAVVDGVLGLDFMRGLCLTVDFRAGTIDLT